MKLLTFKENQFFIFIIQRYFSERILFLLVIDISGICKYISTLSIICIQLFKSLSRTMRATMSTHRRQQWLRQKSSWQTNRGCPPEDASTCWTGPRRAHSLPWTCPTSWGDRWGKPRNLVQGQSEGNNISF